MNRAWKGILRVTCGLFAIVWGAMSLGPIVNGTFATGDLSGWNSLGTAAAVGTLGNIVPTIGNYQAQIASGNGGYALSPTPVFPDVPVATLEATLNLPAAVLTTALPNNNTPFAGSAIYQSFTATAGTTLTFDWNFATNEKIPQSFDAGVVTLLAPGSAQATATELADTTQTASFQAGTGASPFVYVTGYKTTVLNLPSTGTYTVGFIALQTHDDTVSSGLYISNVRGGSVLPFSPVPAAWSLGLLGLGFIAIYSGIRKFRRAN